MPRAIYSKHPNNTSVKDYNDKKPIYFYLGPQNTLKLSRNQKYVYKYKQASGAQHFLHK